MKLSDRVEQLAGIIGHTEECAYYDGEACDCEADQGHVTIEEAAAALRKRGAVMDVERDLPWSGRSWVFFGFVLCFSFGASDEGAAYLFFILAFLSHCHRDLALRIERARLNEGQR